MSTRKCINCNELFTPKRKDAKYCGKNCKSEFNNLRKRNPLAFNKKLETFNSINNETFETTHNTNRNNKKVEIFDKKSEKPNNLDNYTDNETFDKAVAVSYDNGYHKGFNSGYSNGYGKAYEKGLREGCELRDNLIEKRKKEQEEQEKERANRPKKILSESEFNRMRRKYSKKTLVDNQGNDELY